MTVEQIAERIGRNVRYVKNHVTPLIADALERYLEDGWKIHPCGMVSSSHYIIDNVRVTANMEDMVDFFTY